VVPISCYILTYNSEKYLEQIIKKAAEVADEILIVDSGSTDKTCAIAKTYNCRFIERKLDNFSAQRAYAIASCKFDTVLFFDSDEIPSDALVDALKLIKEKGPLFDAYEIKREWIVFGKKVHAMFPITCPDYPIRMLNRTKVVFDERSTLVHETPHGHETLGRVEAPVMHYTFETREELNAKLERYTTIAAEDIIRRKKAVNIFKILISPPFAWVKWFIIKGGWRDGLTGLVLAKYAFDYTRLKYSKARKMNS
jgi:glycosyltransferase involved in cell wall biosynthesis